MKKRLAGFLLASALAVGCAPKRDTFVTMDHAALGRVVVYRNGVAFYERRARVEGGMLTIAVPRDRVDDFLKSLTVVDIASRKALPISIPRQESGDSPMLTIQLQVPTTAPTDVLLTYVTESPAWKPTYRVAVGDKGKVMLEGWAIVDNTSGEDWKNVVVGVGSSSALSFKYDLWSVRHVQRDTLHDQEQFAIAPPTGGSTYGGAGDKDADGAPEVADLDDNELRGDAPGQGAVAATESAGAYSDVSVQGNLSADEEDRPATASRQSHRHGSSKKTAAAPAAAAPPPPPPAIANGDYKTAQFAQRLASSNKAIVIQVYADQSKGDAARRANDRANAVMNQLVDQGIAANRIKIEANVAPGNAERVRLVAQAATEAQSGQQSPAIAADAPPVGESHFANEMPMTVARGASAMVAMVRGETDGEVVYLFDPESERGNDHFAFRAVRFRNPTDSTLETGPVTVYGSERFIGEGLTEPIPPKSLAVVPYALDRQVLVETTESENDKLSRLVTVERGVLTAEVQHVRHEKLVLTNRLPEVAKVYIRHTVGKGWSLIAAPPKFERIGDAHLFEVDLKPGEVQTVDIAEATPMERSLDLGSSPTMEMLKIYADGAAETPELKAQLEKVLGIHKKLVDLQDEQESLAARLADYRERMDELHAQLVTLQAVKTGGDLMVHLKEKMKDISERVQKATIAKVDGEEQIMLTRVRFQDAIAELALPDATKLAAQK